MRRLVATALVLFALPSAGRAAVAKTDCAPVDLTSSFVPIRNQGSIESCFAFATADLVSYNQGVRPPDAVSAFDVDLNYASQSGDSVTTAVNRINATTADQATRDWIRNYATWTIDNDYKAHYGQPLEQQWSEGSEFLALVSYAQAGRLCLESDFPSSDQPGSDSSTYMKRYEAAVLSHVPADDLAYATDVLKRISDLKCAKANPLKPLTPSIRSVTRGTNSVAAGLIASQIAKRQPVVIRYDSSFLQTGDLALASTAEHASLIIGTRWDKNSNSCQFKLRNSWGVTCAPYESAVRKRCEQGYVWLTEGELNSRTEELVTIAPNN